MYFARLDFIKGVEFIKFYQKTIEIHLIFKLIECIIEYLHPVGSGEPNWPPG